MAIAFEQSKSVDSGSVSSAALAFTSNVKAGSLIVVALRISGHGLFTSVTDDHSGSYSTANGPLDDVLGEDCYVVYAPDAAGGATTVTVTLSGAATLRWAIHEYSGIATSSPLDKNGGQANASTTTPVSPSVTTTSANELIFGYVDDGSSTGVTLTPTAPYNKREELLVGGALKMTTFDKIVAATAAYTAGGTWGTSSAGASQIATFVQAPPTKIPILAMAPYIPASAGSSTLRS